MPRSKRSLASAEARKKGLDFEHELQKYHYLLEASGAAIIFKAEPMARMIGGRWQPVGKGPADWWGTAASGTAIFFESKVRESEGRTPRQVFTLDKRDEHQLIDLQRVVEIAPTARAFVLAAWGFDGSYEFIVHPIELIWERKVERRFGLSCGLHPHWLPVVLSTEYAKLVARGRLEPHTIEDVPF